MKTIIEEFKIYYRRYKGPHNKISFKEAFVLWCKACRLSLFKPSKPSKPKHLKNNVLTNYFKYKPDQLDHVKKATYAWHNPNLPNSHKFDGQERDSKCIYCSRTREQVRYDNLSYDCHKVPDDMVKHINNILKSETEKYFSLTQRAKKEVPKIINKKGMSGETLFFLHDTHGWCPEIVSDIVSIPDDILKEYYKEREKTQTVSRDDRKTKTKVIEPNKLNN